MKINNKIICAIFAMSALVFSPISIRGQSQTSPQSKYQVVAIPLPQLTIAASTATNLANGWTNTVQSTNISTIWTNGAGGGSPGFVNVTNIVTNNALTFARIGPISQRNLGVQIQFTGNGAGTDQYITWWVKSVDGVNFDTTATQIIAGTANGTTMVTVPTNIDMLGFAYLQCNTISNSSGTRQYTNNAFNAGVYGGNTSK